jgi:hypothetical protein
MRQKIPRSLGDSPTALNGIGESKPQGKKRPQKFNLSAAHLEAHH